MRTGVDPGSPWTLLVATALAAVFGLVGAVVMELRERSAADVRRPAGIASAAPAAAVPARLDEAVTKIGTKPGDRAAQRALSLVESAHTAVVSTDEPSVMTSAATLALHARAPLIVVPAQDRSTEPSAQTASPASGLDVRGAVASMRRLGVVRALVVDRELDAVAQRGGARQIVRVAWRGAHSQGVRKVFALAAADEPTPPSPPAGLDREVASELSRRPVPAPRRSGVAVLAAPQAEEATATVVAARAVGHQVIVTAPRDLRGDPALGTRLAEISGSPDPPRLVLTGAAFDAVDADELALQAAAATSGLRLPAGGQLVFGPDADDDPHRYIALYGVPGSPVLGALGEQPLGATFTRVKRLARQYAAVVGDDTTVVPCFEIIATVASASAGHDGNYSREQPVAGLRPVVDAAADAGVYVLLDLQPGRTDFVTQAKRYRSLLVQPHVGLALDPEWRLGPQERHLEQIGAVDSDEINRVIDWLADLTERRALPQKLLLLHQFRLSMLPDRAQLDTSRDSLAYVIQMDGQGSQGQKLETWSNVIADPPAGVLFGWKNFHDEDQPMLSPEQTMALRPRPVFVSYQ